MSNTSEQFVNSTRDLLFKGCSTENYVEFIFCYILVTLCFFVATPAHFLCFWFYFCFKRKMKDTQVFFQNNIIMEIIFCVECGLEIITIFFVNIEILWYVMYFLFGLSWSGRPLLQACICIEQYLAVVHPVIFLRYKGMKYRIIVAVAVWLVAFACGVYNVYIYVFPDFVFISVSIITLAVISYCCVSVLCALKQPGPGDIQQTVKDGGNQQKRNAFNTIFSALLLILFSYLPQALIIVCTFLGGLANQVQCKVIYLTMFLSILFVIITSFMKLYKEAFTKCLRHLK